jgi:hypothetical protein
MLKRSQTLFRDCIVRIDLQKYDGTESNSENYAPSTVLSACSTIVRLDTETAGCCYYVGLISAARV